ncbi:Lrp/AsnC ligand binding domain-containing protein [Candidatus Bathyarchaeota archaeon]|nr:Lrp/AsnC ligand binding domain-containing protein [Candidatus Bathyarchaeota archaeon]
MAIEAYILFKVSSGMEREACKKIAEFDEVLVAGIIYGEYDLVARVSLPDLQMLEEFLAEKLRKVPSILLTSTMLIAREYKGKTQRN